MSEKVITHQLSELPAEVLASNHTKADVRNIKSLVGQPLVLTSAKLMGKGEVTGYKVTAHLAEDDKEFSVLVYSAQPKTVIAAIQDGELWPMEATFVKQAGRYLITQPA